MKKFRMLLTILMVSVCSWQGAWAQEEVTVSVSLKEPNSLSTEILAQPGIDDIKTVVNLTVTGELGEKDWQTLQSITALKNLDLSAARCEAIPDEQFYGSSKCPNLVMVKLPSNLKTIGKSAFGAKTNLVTVEIPSTVTTIGRYCFSRCYNLENCSLADLSITTIPSGCFNSCIKLLSFNIPATVRSIEDQAFYGCNAFSSDLPAGLVSVGYGAFMETAMTDKDIILPEGMIINDDIFRASGIKSITMPTTYYKFTDMIYLCTNITDITFKSPTVVASSGSGWNPKNVANITLHVPSHLVTLYKAHTNWSQYKDVVAIEPDVTDYTVQADLELNYAMRIAGTPNVTFSFDDSDYHHLLFKITGDAAQNFNNFTAVARLYSYYYNNKWTMIFSECSNVNINGSFKQRVYTDGRSWRFMCLPFDFKVGDITTDEGKFAIRTYNGALRNAQNEATTGDNWTNRTVDDVITAGTGFIFQTSKSTWTTFKAKSGGTNYAFKTSSDVLNIPLAENNSNTEASAANTGWNMVGNPWMTWYNTHKINYTAPFCYYDENYQRYVTVSIQDDDYALPPLKAIFVQCPTGISSIGFPASGRQLNDKITSQNGTRAAGASMRLLLDIQVAGSGELKDKTRLVLNPEAKAEYEIGRDASKFFSSETLCPQVYTTDADGTQYAINERPDQSGTISLGMVLATDGTYEISAIRNYIGQVILTDHETGIKTDLQQNSYSFSGKKGTYENRFSISFSSNGTTAIQSLKEVETKAMEVFTLDGQMVGNSTDGLKKGVYVVRQGEKAQKIIIK